MDLEDLEPVSKEQIIVDFNKLLAQVDCRFMHGDKPHYSASSPDKPRYHVWDSASDCSFMCDTEYDLLGAIIYRHQLIIEQLSQHMTASKEVSKEKQS